MNAGEFYRGQKTDKEEVISRLVIGDRWFSFWRFVAGLSMLSSFFYGLYINQSFLLAFAAFLFVAFIVLVKLHLKHRARLRYERFYLQSVKDELGYLSGDLTPFSDGFRFANSNHLYSGDLDLFGPGSLYQRINRTATAEAASRLSARIARLDLKQIVPFQEAIKELSTLPEFLLSFKAKAATFNKEQNAGEIIKQWSDEQTFDVIWLKPLLAVLLSIVFPICAILFIVVDHNFRVDILIWPFSLNLIVFAQVWSKMKKSYRLVDQLTKAIKTHTELIDLVGSQEFSSDRLQQFKSSLAESEDGAKEALSKLARILSQLDSIHNAVAMLALNGVCLYHIHWFVALNAWKKAHGPNVKKWLNTVYDFDVEVSLGGYAFNHAEHSWPAVSEQTEFSGKGVAHPFLGSTAVANDIEWKQNGIVILTGSNMAGKSTFLRSIGLAVVMAHCGLPVFARQLIIGEFELLSSMKPQDSVNENRSYFQSEVLRLRSIMDVIETGKPCLILLDEILRGTNSRDKRLGSMAVLKRMSSFNVFGVVATHDVEMTALSEEMPAVYRPMYFESVTIDNQLSFDYVLREGVCQSPNATQLLKNHKLID